MKLIHVPFCYWPDPVGGTEVYVDSLAREQQRRGLDIMLAAPASRQEEYRYKGVQVRRFPVTGQVRDLRDLYGEGDPTAAQGFGQILDEERPDLVHLHAFTRGVSLRMVREAKSRGISVVFSYHTPTVSCQRGTLLRWGAQVCDGMLRVHECARCSLHGHGLNRIGSGLAGSIPPAVGRFLGAARASGGIWTAARMTELVRIRQRVFRSLISEVDHVVALCQWVKEVLLRNGVPERKISVSRQGLDAYSEQRASKTVPSPPMRMAFLGRLDVTKGVHVLLEALKLNPGLPIRLDIFGVAQGEVGEKYLRELKALANGDTRVAFESPISSGDVIVRLRDYHLLAAPSQWLETGPRVILEAFAAGVPVLGSKLGGIAELVRHGVDGLLVEPRSVREWAAAIRTLCDDAGLLYKLRSGIRSPRSVSAVAQEMEILYRTVVRNRLSASRAIAAI